MKGPTAIFLMVFFWCSTASALIISGEHMLSNDRMVNLQGLEWLSFDASKIANDNAVFDDTRAARKYVLQGTYEGYSDWRYATQEEAEALLDSLWSGDVEGLDSSNLLGAEWFFQNLGISELSGNEPGGISEYFLYGSEKDMSAVNGFGNTFLGEVAIF